MASATLVVAPVYLEQMTGVTAIKITARKLYMCDAKLNTIKKCNRRPTDEVDLLSFTDFIDLIDTRHFLENKA